MIERIKQDLLQAYRHRVDRLNHIYGVRDTALKLAKIHRLDREQVLLAAYLHDLTKYEDDAYHKQLIQMVYDETILETFTPSLWHAYSAAALGKIRYGIADADVLKAVESHTIGRAGMSDLETVIFISDYIEPYRLYPDCVAARELAFVDLDKAVLYAIDTAIRFYEKQATDIPKAAYEARNYYERRMR